MAEGLKTTTHRRSKSHNVKPSSLFGTKPRVTNRNHVDECSLLYGELETYFTQ